MNFQLISIFFIIIINSLWFLLGQCHQTQALQSKVIAAAPVTKLTDYILNEIFLYHKSSTTKTTTTTTTSSFLSNSYTDDSIGVVTANIKKLLDEDSNYDEKQSTTTNNDDEFNEKQPDKSNNNLYKNYKETTTNEQTQYRSSTDDDSEGFIARKKTFLDYYYEGVQLYLSNDWEGCINFLEHSLNLYHEYYESVTFCRLTCEIQRNNIKKFLHTYNYENHHFYESLIKKTLCLEKCRQEQLSTYSKYFTLDDEQKLIFKERKPYQYLQLCYYRDQEIEKAILATYTALVAAPDDELMKKNIRYYSTLNTFNFEKLKDLEDKEFSEHYIQGVDHYEAQNWQLAINSFEKFIPTWLLEHDKCRAFCDGEFYQGWLPDFTTSISNHYVYTLRCKQNCTKQLSYTNGRFYDDLYPSAYDYLQFSYNKVGDIQNAVKCVASYLMFYNDSEEMLQNRQYYENLNEIQTKDFIPRNEAEKFVGRAKYEYELLNYVDQEFQKLFAKDDQTFRLLSIQSNLSGYEHIQGNIKKPSDLVNNNNYNFMQIVQNYKDNFIMKFNRNT